MYIILLISTLITLNPWVEEDDLNRNSVIKPEDLIAFFK